jgi:hypothetical protein
MEKTIPPFPFIVARDEEKEEIKLQYQIIWHGETLTLMTLKKLIKNNRSPLSSAPGEMPEEKEGGPAVVDGGGGDGSARAGVINILAGMSTRDGSQPNGENFPDGTQVTWGMIQCL